MGIDEVIAQVEIAFKCPDASEIDDGYSEEQGKPNGSKALSKQQAEALISGTISEVIYNSCHDAFTVDGPMGGHAKDPVKVNPDTPEELDRTVHDEETLSREIDANDRKY